MPAEYPSPLPYGLPEPRGRVPWAGDPLYTAANPGLEIRYMPQGAHRTGKREVTGWRRLGEELFGHLVEPEDEVESAGEHEE